MDTQNQSPDRRGQDESDLEMGKAGPKIIRPCPTISPQRTPSMFAELSKYPEDQRTGRYAELAAYGLECMYRAGMLIPPQSVPAKPSTEVQMASAQSKPLIDDSAIDLNPDSGL